MLATVKRHELCIEFRQRVSKGDAYDLTARGICTQRGPMVRTVTGKCNGVAGTGRHLWWGEGPDGQNSHRQISWSPETDRRLCGGDKPDGQNSHRQISWSAGTGRHLCGGEGPDGGARWGPTAVGEAGGGAQMALKHGAVQLQQLRGRPHVHQRVVQHRMEVRVVRFGRMLHQECMFDHMPEGVLS